MELKNKISDLRKTQIKDLWDKFQENYTADEIKEIEKQHEKLSKEWQEYKTKILDGSFSLDDYTNTLGNSTATMPGGYLCNFLERTTRHFFGSSKPGTAINFGVKLNNDLATYTIGKNNPGASRDEAETTFEINIKSLIENILKADLINEKIDLVENSNYGAKQILRKLVVLDQQMDFIYVYSDDTINELYEEMSGGSQELNLYKNKDITSFVKQILNIDNTHIRNYMLSQFLWKYTNSQGIADADSPNVILYGPPGTGKTYAVKNSLDFVCQGDRNRYEFVQFHPSFTYEDFIDGIKPKGVTTDGNIKFELVDGIFKRFCKKAKQDPTNDYYFVVDEINRANLSSVFGETLLCLEKDYRHNINSKNTKNLFKTQYSTLIEEMIKDGAGEDLAYEYINGNAYFGVPSNVFFIGMMNDVDKSIDAFDLALRRRFKWERKDCDYDVISDETKYRNGSDFDNIETYKNSCIKLNNYISEKLGLGKSYEFGHSFFMKMSDIANRKIISENNIKVLFNLHLRPTLKEYLRALYAEKELDNKLEQALDTFKKPFSKN